MYTVINKQILGLDVKRLDILAKPIALKVQPGQFVMLITDERGEWVPMSVAESDARRGTITLMVQEVGPATKRLGDLQINDPIHAILGPFGKPAYTKKEGVVLCVASGIGTAQLLPVCRALNKAGNKLIGVIGAKTRRAVMLEAQMRIACQKLFITTEDGTYDRKGMATDVVRKILEQQTVNMVYAIGSVEMLETICGMTRGKGIRTMIQVRPLMFCGTGICGSCRLKVAGETVLACQDGPEFDGHEVDFEVLRARMAAADRPPVEVADTGAGPLGKGIFGIFSK